MLPVYKYTTGQPDEGMDWAEANRLLEILRAEDRVAAPYDSDDGLWDVYEIYDEGCTVSDYPDGDPYADALWMPKSEEPNG